MTFNGARENLGGCYITVPTMFEDPTLDLNLPAIRRQVTFLSVDRLAMIAVVAAGGPIGSDISAQKEFVRTCQTYHPPGPVYLVV